MMSATPVFPEFEVVSGAASDYLAAAREAYAQQARELASLRQLNKTLEAQNKRLSDQVMMLEEAVGAWDSPGFVRLGLTPKEASLMAYLVRRGSASIEQIMAAMYSDSRGDCPGQQIVQVLVCKIRRKMKPHGLRIWTSKGYGGYWIDKEGQERAKALLASVAT